MMKIALSAALLILSQAEAAQTKTEADSLRLDSLSNHELGEVAVVAQRQIVKNDIDKLTYDVQADDDSKAKSLMEMLKKVPMVTVDGQDNVKVKGSSDYKIYRNGHRDPAFEGERLADILKAIPASTIKKIEVITDPGAKEDAEGTNYILNIVMLDNARFGGVSANLSASVNQRGQNQEMAYVTAKAGKLTTSAYFGAVTIPKGSQRNKMKEDYIYNSGQHYVNSQYQDVGPATVWFGNLDLSYEIDSLNLVTVSGNFQDIGNPHVSVWDLTDQTAMYRADGTKLYSYDALSRIDGYKQSQWSARADFQHKTHLDGEVLTFSYLYSHNRHGADIYQTYDNIEGTVPMSYTAYRNYNDRRFYEHTLQLDYIRPFGQYHQMEVGAKYIDRKGKNDLQNEYEGAEASNIDNLFQNNTRVAALYAEWIYSQAKWSARAGLRYEYSRLSEKFLRGEGTDFHKNLNDWVPSVSVKYNFSNANSLKLSYSTSISRPSVSYLNPTRDEGPDDVSYGNINLKSSRWNKLSLDFTHVGQKLTWNLSPFVNWSNNSIGTVQRLEDGKQASTYDDTRHERSWGITGYMQLQPWKGAQLMVNAAAYNTTIKDHGLGYSLSRWRGYVSADFSQQLPWKLRLSLNGYTDFGQNVGTIYRINARWHDYGLSLQRSFLKEGRLTVSLHANNIFEPNYTKQNARIVQGDYTGTSMWSNQRPEYTLRISLRLGKLKASVKKADTSIENSDMMSGSGGLL